MCWTRIDNGVGRGFVSSEDFAENGGFLANLALRFVLEQSKSAEVWAFFILRLVDILFASLAFRGIVEVVLATGRFMCRLT